MFQIGQQFIFEPENSIELSLAYVLCKNPEAEPEPIPIIDEPKPEVEETEGLSPAWVVLGIVGVVVLFTTIGLFLPCCCRKKSNRIPDNATLEIAKNVDNSPQSPPLAEDLSNNIFKDDEGSASDIEVATRIVLLE